MNNRKYDTSIQRKMGFYGAIFWMLFLCACGGGSAEPTLTGSIWFIINPKVGTAPVELNSSYVYDNEAGNEFRISKFRQYISGIKLYQEGGKEVNIPINSASDGIYLIDAADRDSYSFELSNIPEGNYNRISFLVGIDEQSLGDIPRTGMLSPSGGIFLDGTANYLHWEFEGTSSASPLENEQIAFRAGGANSLYRADIIFGSDVARIRQDQSPVVELNADIAQMFSSPQLVDFSSSPQILDISQSQQMAQQFANGVNYDHLHN